MIALAIGLGLSFVTLDKKSDYITVGGQAEVSIAPDKAISYISIVTLAQTAQATETENSQIVEKVKAALKEEGIEANSIETSNYYLYKKQDWSYEGSIDKGYELYNTLKVTSTIGKASAVVKKAVAAGATSVDRIEFTITKDGQDAIVAAAMSKATQAAKAKAQRVASDVGSSVGRVLKIEEGSWWITTSSGSSTAISDIPSEYANNVITPQQMAVQANVNVVFALN